MEKQKKKKTIIFGWKKKEPYLELLIVLGFNNMSTLVGHFVITQRKGEKR